MSDPLFWTFILKNFMVALPGLLLAGLVILAFKAKANMIERQGLKLRPYFLGPLGYRQLWLTQVLLFATALAICMLTFNMLVSAGLFAHSLPAHPAVHSAYCLAGALFVTWVLLYGLQALLLRKSIMKEKSAAVAVNAPILEVFVFPLLFAILAQKGVKSLLGLPTATAKNSQCEKKKLKPTEKKSPVDKIFLALLPLGRVPTICIIMTNLIVLSVLWLIGTAQAIELGLASTGEGRMAFLFLPLPTVLFLAHTGLTMSLSHNGAENPGQRDSAMAAV